jgi:hypothetical protein
MIARRLGLATLVGLCALGCLLMLGVASAGAVVSQFGSEGSEAGQFIEPRGVAIDQESSDVYVVDRNNQRVEKFGPEGTFLMAWGWGVADGETKAPQTCVVTCFSGVEGDGSGAFSSPEGVAIDNDPLSESHSDVYVLDARNHRMEKFDSSGYFLLMSGGEVNKTEDETAGATAAQKDLCTAASGDICTSGTEGSANGQFEIQEGESIAVGADGTVYVGDVNRVQEFSSDGAYQSQVTLAGAGRTNALAVDHAGDLYVLSAELAGVRKYNGAGTELGEPRDASGRPETLAVGPTDELLVDDEAGGRHHILEYDSSGTETASFDSGAGQAGIGVAVGEGLGLVYVAGQQAVRLVAEPSPGPLAVAGGESAAPIQPTTATLHATINPEGNDPVYRIEYGTSTSYGTSVPVPDGEIPASFEDTPISAEVSGLSVDTVYHYRVVAKNSAGTFTGADRTFTTLPPALIDGESSTNVASKSATLSAQINPLGSDTTYRFEYGTSTSYGTTVPSSEGDAGPGTSDVGVAMHIQGLEPATTYHFRLVTRNVLGSIVGGDRVFTTQLAKSSSVLPDGRAWEMVSPVDKQGAAVEAMANEGGVIQASVSGNAIAYFASGATEPEPQGNRNFEVTQVLSKRGPSGWSSQDIDTPNATPGPLAIGEGWEYRLFSSDLSLGFVEPRTATPLPPLPKNAEGTIYLRNDANGTYEPLVTAGNVRPGTEFGFGYGEGSFRNLEFAGATPDLSHVVFKSFAALTANAVESPHPGFLSALYEWSTGQLQLVSVLPDDKPVNEDGGGAWLGAGSQLVRHAISDDGSRVVWEGAGPTGKHLYLRDMTKAGGETVQVDSAQGVKEVSDDNTVRFQTASSDGSRVFFTSVARLTSASGSTGKADLYEFEVTSGQNEALAGKLADLTVDENIGQAADVLDVIGASEDGSSVYFEANSLLGDAVEHGANGSPNLYVERFDASTKAWSQPHFIAALASEDIRDRDRPQGLQSMASRVSPNGRYLAFMSSRSLTGYDNHDASSGAADEEVFVYDADTGRVSCASCDPTGASPNGVLDPGGYPGLLVDHVNAWEHSWLGALIPGWTTVDVSHSLYQSRYLSDDGRLFFDSPDALVPRDTNGTWDVYENEPAGVGGCVEGSATFSQADGGCVDLISSGGSAEESAFVDASETGDDVFFVTTAGLVGQDGDGAFDMYDAHACSDSSPCLPPVPASAPACSTGDSCKAAPSPQPASFGAPSSQTFSGAGNLAPVAASPTVRSKPLSDARKLSRALRACAKKSKHKRALCERRARKRYGSKARAKRSAANTSLPVRAGR